MRCGKGRPADRPAGAAPRSLNGRARNGRRWLTCASVSTRENLCDCTLCAFLVAATDFSVDQLRLGAGKKNAAACAAHHRFTWVFRGRRIATLAFFLLADVVYPQAKQHREDDDHPENDFAHYGIHSLRVRPQEYRGFTTPSRDS